MSANKEWLDGLKPGDEVAENVGFREGHAVLRVERRTGTQIMCVFPGSEYEYRYRAKDGKKVGVSGWDARYLEPVTDEIREERIRARLLSRVRNAEWGKMDTATLRAVCALLDPKERAP